MDRVTKSMLDSFLSENGLVNLREKEDEAFEHFTGYLVVAEHYTESFESDDIHVGAGGDCGIDCLAILVNGSLVSEPEEIEDLCETNGYLDVSFIFSQSERSASFDTAKIGQFAFGVRDFFSESPALVQNEQIKHKSKILTEIYKRSSKFKKGNPLCYLYYVTTGKWNNDRNLQVRKDAELKDIQDLNIFRKVEFECIDVERIHKLYRDSKNAISKEVLFSEKTVLPDLPGVEQAYLGFLKVSEFYKLIENLEGEIITSIFYDNIRHWQEWNPVNREMFETLKNKDRQIYFPLFNNGVTIVAKKIIPTGNRFTIEDYQIVNGCQTTFVLHEAKEFIQNEILIPIRLIATEDMEIKNSIIVATNKQTAVTDEQLFTLSEFPKQLEAYFPTFENHKKLFYERRSKQYASETGIERIRVVNMTTLVRVYSSMFLELPHRTTRNYKALLRFVGTEIFGKDHRQEMYYLSAYANFRLDYLFRSQFIDASFKQSRYHLLLIFRYLANPSPLPYLNSHAMVRYCSPIMDILWDENAYKVLFQAAVDIVIKVADGNLHRDNIRTEPFTAAIKNEISLYLKQKEEAKLFN